MTLEKEITQTKFKSEYQKLAVNIIYTHGWLISKQNEIFRKYDITATQFNILRILRGQQGNPASISLLQDRMLDKMSDTSRLVDRLKNKGFVERIICPNDRRKVEVTITDAGLGLLSQIDEHEHLFEDALRNLSEEEAETLNKLLDKARG